jgi:hypothetical protein
MLTSAFRLGIFYMPQICDMGPMALLLLRGKACWGFYRPEKSWRLRPSFNPQTWVLKGGTLPPDHRSRLSKWLQVFHRTVNVFFCMVRQLICFLTVWQWTGGEHGPSKHGGPLKHWQNVASQKSWISSSIAVRTSNLTTNIKHIPQTNYLSHYRVSQEERT